MRGGERAETSGEPSGICRAALFGAPGPRVVGTVDQAAGLVARHRDKDHYDIALEVKGTHSREFLDNNLLFKV